MTAVVLSPASPRSAVLRQAPLRRPSVAGRAWSLNDLLRVITGNSLAAVALLVAWFGTSGSVDPSRSAAFTVVGIAAVILQGSANVVWLLRGRRSIGERRAALMEQFLEVLPSLAQDVPVQVRAARAGTAATPAVTPQQVVAVAAATRYHHPDCQLAVGKADLILADVEEHESAGRVACGVCLS